MAGYIDSIDPTSPLSNDDPAEFPAEMRTFKGYVQNALWESLPGYATVAALKAESITAGLMVRTEGYAAAGDKGGATYFIKTAADYAATPDEYGDHTLANTNVAVLQYDDSLRASQFGVVGDGSTDDSTAIQAALDYAVTRMAFVTFGVGTYILDTKIALSEAGGNTGFGIIGEGTITPRSGSSSTTRQSGVTFRASHTGRVFEFVGVENLVLENFEVNSENGSARWTDYTGGDYSSSGDKEAIYIKSDAADRIAGPKFKDVFVRHQPGDGIRVISSNDAHFVNTNASFCNGAGVVNDDGSYDNTGVAATINAYSALSVFRSVRVANVKGPAVFIGTHLANTTDTGGTRFIFDNLETQYCGLDYPDAVTAENIQVVISGANTVSFKSSAIGGDVYDVTNGSGIGIYAQNTYNLDYDSSRFVECAIPIVADQLENMSITDSAVVLGAGAWAELVQLRKVVGVSRNFSVRRMITSGHLVATGTDIIQNFFGTNYDDNTYFYGHIELQPRYGTGSIASASEFSTFIGAAGASGAGYVEWRTDKGTPAQNRMLVSNVAGVPHLDTTGTINADTSIETTSTALAHEGTGDSGYLELGRDSNNNKWKIEAGISGVDSSLHLYYDDVQMGVFASSTGIYVPTSVRSAKKLIEPLEYKKARSILDVDVVSYLFKDQDEIDMPNIGIIADDALTYVPELVPVNDSGEPQGFNYAGMGPYLLKIVQDQQVRIEALEQQLFKG